MSAKTTLKTCLLLMMLLSWTSCGWRLRGTVLTADLPQVVVDGYEPAFVNELKKELQQQGLKTTESGLWSLYVEQHKYSRHVGAVNQAGQTQSFLITLMVKFRILNPPRPPGDSQQVYVSRDMQYDQVAVLSKDAEEKIIRADLLREAGSLIIHRLRAHIKKPGAAQPHKTAPAKTGKDRTK